jgi:cytosine deaminase
MSRFKNYAFSCHGERRPNDPAKWEREGESNHPENVSLTTPRQGVLPKQRHFAAAAAFKAKCMGENSLKLHGKGQIFRMLRLCARPASGTRASLSMTSLKYFRQSEKLLFVPISVHPCLSLLTSFHMNSKDQFLQAAIEEARQGLAEGGIPIGSVIVHGGKIIGRGHNRRVQKGSSILHGEMDALENAGRQSAAVYRECVLYTTLSPCSMCSGAILLYGIPRVIVGENKTFMGEEELLRSRGVAVEVVQSEECIRMMEEFIRKNPRLWDEDIGV